MVGLVPLLGRTLKSAARKPGLFHHHVDCNFLETVAVEQRARGFCDLRFGLFSMFWRVWHDFTRICFLKISIGKKDVLEHLLTASMVVMISRPVRIQFLFQRSKKKKEANDI